MKLFNWVKDHPIVATVIMVPFVTCAFFLPVEHDWFGWTVWCLYFIGTGFLVANKYIAVWLLVFSLATQPVCAQEQQATNAWGVPVAVVVVVCGAGYCVYRLARFCAKKFPKEKPANTNELFAAYGGAGDEYGGSWNHGALGSCVSPDASFATVEHSPATTFSLNVFVASSSSLVATMSADTSEGSMQTWPQFQADVAAHGLVVTGQADGSQYFSRNRQPVSAGEVPIRFDVATGQVIHDRGGELVQIVVEASTDLEHWQRLAFVQHSVGDGFKIVDVSAESQQFYRALIIP